MKKYYSLLLVSLAGCTSIGTVRTQDVSPLIKNEALVGVSYSLPAIQYTVKTTRILSECKNDATPAFAIKPEVTSNYLSGERYEIDPTKLSSFLKTSSVGLTFYDDLDTLKGFNAAADDKTGDVIVDVARIGIAAASIAASGGTVAAGVVAMGETGQLPIGLSPSERVALEAAVKQLNEGNVPEYDVILACSPVAVERLSDLKAKTAQLGTLEGKLATLNEEIAQERTLSGFQNFASADVSRLIVLIKQSIALSKQVTAKKKEVTDAQALLQVEASDKWPTVTWAQPDPAKLEQTINFSGNIGRHKKFCENFSLFFITPSLTTAQLAASGFIIPPKPSCEVLLGYVSKQSQILLVLSPETKRTSAAMPGAHERFLIDSSKPSPGIFIREPERARLLIKQKDVETKVWKTIFTDEITWAPQIGRLRFLPFESGPFENEAMSLALRKDGRIESISYETKDAALARLSKAGADAAEKIAKAREDAETEYRSDVDRARANAQYARDESNKSAGSVAAQQQADIAEIDYQIAKAQKTRTLLKEQALADAAIVAEATELTLIDSELSLLRAEKERLELVRAVRDLRKLEADAGS